MSSIGEIFETLQTAIESTTSKRQNLNASRDWRQRRETDIFKNNTKPDGQLMLAHCVEIAQSLGLVMLDEMQVVDD